MTQRLPILLAAGMAFGALAIHAQQTATPQLGVADTTIRTERFSCNLFPMTMPFGGGSYLGVQIEEVTPDKAKELGLKEEYGAIINKVMEGTAAEKAGLLANDVIVGWNGGRVESTRQLIRLVRETPVGRAVRIEILRNGSPMTINATIGKQENEMFEGFNSTMDSMMDWKGLEAVEGIEGLEGLEGFEGLNHFNFKMDTAWSFDTTMKGGCHGFIIGGESNMNLGMQRPRLGVQLQDLTPQLAKYFGTNQKSGALISEVVGNSAAERAGLQAGDIILAIDGKEVGDPGDAAQMIREHKEGTVELRILRERQEQTITATLEKAPEMGTNPMLQPNGERQMRKFHFKGGKGPRQFEMFFFGPDMPQMQEQRDGEAPTAPQEQIAPTPENNVEFSNIIPGGMLNQLVQSMMAQTAPQFEDAELQFPLPPMPLMAPPAGKQSKAVAL